MRLNRRSIILFPFVSAVMGSVDRIVAGSVPDNSEGRLAHEEASPEWESPFSSNSPWKAMPVKPRLGDQPIPPDNNYPYINDNAYGVSVYRTVEGGGDVTVFGRNGAAGPSVSDEVTVRPVKLSNWPIAVTPPSGTDGHCEIYDEASALWHSFYGLSFNSSLGRWECYKYDVFEGDATGWGTPERPDGPRAAGTSAAGGLLRRWELNQPVLNHALALATHLNVPKSGPVYPATLQDYNGYSVYKGMFPIGTLFMLPPSFDAEGLAWNNARIIARTLKVHGARLVDTTQKTFAFVGETGSGWSNTNLGKTTQADRLQDLAKIRDALREVTSADEWLDGNGDPLSWKPFAEMNLLSMRGPWKEYPDNKEQLTATYDCIRRALICEDTAGLIQLRKIIYTQNPGAEPNPWFAWKGNPRWYLEPQPERMYSLTVTGEGTIEGAISIKEQDFSTTHFQSAFIKPGMRTELRWPASTRTVTEMFVRKPAGARASIRMELNAI